MPRIFVLLVGFGASWILSVSLVSASGEPSAGARGMPGAVGTFEFQPSDWMEGTTSWWKDSDGVDPDVAGCHIGADEKGQPNGRMFGEACSADGWRVESNPGAGVLHSHSNDVGHPDKFSCNVWCIAKGSVKGACVAAASPPCEQSAVCKCE